MKKHSGKRILSLFLTLVMLFTMCPVTVFAADTGLQIDSSGMKDATYYAGRPAEALSIKASYVAPETGNDDGDDGSEESAVQNEEGSSGNGSGDQTAAVEIYYQWQSRTSGTWENISGTNSDSFTPSTDAEGVTSYRAIAYGYIDEDYIEAYSEPAVITVEPAPLGLSDLKIYTGGYYYWDYKQIDIGVFDPDETDYTAKAIAYSSSSNARKLYINATAPTDAVITASCGDTKETLTSGTQMQVGTGDVLTFGKNNTVTITVSRGEETVTYTVTIPMLPNFKFSQNLTTGGLVTAGTESVDLTVTVNSDVQTYLTENNETVKFYWFSSVDKSKLTSTNLKKIAGGNEVYGISAVEGAATDNLTSTLKVTPTVEQTYYCAAVRCGDDLFAMSTVQEVTLGTAQTAPTALTIEAAFMFANGDTLEKRTITGTKKVVMEVGDKITYTVKDQDGTVVDNDALSWSYSAYGVTTRDNVLEVTQEIGGGASYFSATATSRYNSSVKVDSTTTEAVGYKANKTELSATLSADGQSTPRIEFSGGVSGYNIWTYNGAENIAELTSEANTTNNWFYFNALRPGSFSATFKLNFNDKLTQTLMATIKGVAVETAAGERGKTYLFCGDSATKEQNTVTLKAYTEKDKTLTKWESANTDVATVDENGVVTAVGVGSTIIKATDNENQTGGIKVVVDSIGTPHFESLNFTTGYSGVSGWTSSTYQSNKTDYSDVVLSLTRYNSPLSLASTTLYDKKTYIAVAEYTNFLGEAQKVEVNSGAATMLPDIAFGESAFYFKFYERDENKTELSEYTGGPLTVYSFKVTRSRDTSKTIAYSGGLALQAADGGALSTNSYNGKTEGFLFRANEDGTLNGSSYIVDYKHYNYRAFLLNGRESFQMAIKGYTAYTHIRYSVDGGATWKDLKQGGGATGVITIPARVGEVNPVAKVLIQVQDDATFAASKSAGNDGYFGTTPSLYTVWIEQIPAPEITVQMETAVTNAGDWYPAFDPDHTSYRIYVENGAAAPTLTFTATEDAVVTIGDSKQIPDENGQYTLALTRALQSVTISTADGLSSKAYSFGYSMKSAKAVPDKVLDYLPINSQYTNTAQFGMYPESTLSASETALVSLGNFGGYITYYYENGLTDDPKNKYGVDFYIDGNAFEDQTTGTGLGSMEPGQVWVSEDGSTWYALAGSEHYEDDTIWNYTVNYSKTDDLGYTSWSDNYGNTESSTHGRSFSWPDIKKYPLNRLLEDGSLTLTGILLPCVDGSITGTDTFGSLSSGAKFGYVDVLVNGTENPYLSNDKYEVQSSGFDLAWAVDAQGSPVDVSEKEFHYVKVVTASNIIAGSANEKSTEVGIMFRATPQSTAVGVTDAPDGITIAEGESVKTVAFEENKQVYEIALDNMKYASIKVNGAAENDNIYINNQRVAANEAAEGIKVTGEKLVRIIVQNGDKEPVIYLLKLTSEAQEDLVSKVEITALGIPSVAETVDGKTYTANVSYRIDEISIGVTANGASVTIDGEAAKESYALQDGENKYVIKAVKDNIAQEITLIVNREKTPISSGEDISVFFKLLGDDKHGAPNGEADTHTLKAGNLQTWLNTKEYVVPAEYKVVDVILKALTENNIEHSNPGGNYIDSVTYNGITLSEKDNGEPSGWMYTLNGVHSQNGVAEQTLKDGDVIVFHYSDDYTLEDRGDVEQPPVPGVDATDAELKDAYKATGEYLAGKAPKTGSEQGEWMMFGLARAEKTIDSDNLTAYYTALDEYLAEKYDSTTGRLHDTKATENQRIALALTALGENAVSYKGMNILKALQDTGWVTSQGNNSTAFALLAINAAESAANDETIAANEEALVASLLNKQLASGGWNITTGDADSDTTAMVVQALAPYYSQADVKEAVDDALTYLAGLMQENGQIKPDGYSATAENTAQVIVALTELGRDPAVDAQFTKNDKTLLDGLMLFYLEDGEFCHVNGGAVNRMATEQSFYALVSYYRLKDDKTSLYDMSDLNGLYDIIVIEPAHGAIEVAASAKAGTTVTVTLKPDLGYVVDKLYIGGKLTAVTDNTATFTMLASDVVISASFKLGENASSELTAAMAALTNDDVKDADEDAYELLGEIEAAITALNLSESELATLKDTDAYKNYAAKVEKFEEERKELQDKAEDDLDDLFKKYDEKDYTEKNWKEIEDIYEDALEALEEAPYAEEIEEILEDAEDAMEDVPVGGALEVTFRLIGDFKHDNGVTDHGEYVTWIETTEYTLDAGATMYDLFMMAIDDFDLNQKGAKNNYVESIQAPDVLGGYWIGEFDNGRNSGWMYTVDGKHPGTGLVYQELEDGDEVIWHYVDDYVKEERNSSSSYYYRWLEARDISPEKYVERTIGEIVTVGKNGSVKPNLGIKDIGKDITFKFQPDNGYVVKDVIIDGESMGAIESYTYKDLSIDSRIEVTFVPAGMEDILTVGKNGSAYPELELDDLGKNITFTFVPDAGYVVGNVIVDGKSVGAVTSYTYKNLSLESRIEAVFALADEITFADVADGIWYAEAVQYVAANGFFSGTGNGNFSPNTTMSRAMMVTVLHNMAQNPTAYNANLFGDVAAGAWYDEAVRWATANGIASGYPGGKFGTNDDVTREQIAVFLYNYAKAMGYDVNTSVSLASYADDETVSTYAKTAMQWAVAEGIISGRDGNLLAAKSNASRAEVAAMVYNFMENVTQ